MSKQAANKPYKLVSRSSHLESTVVRVGKHFVGDGSPTVIAGPCSVESREQILDIAEELKLCGAHMLRGGAFKPRTSPYSFQGLGIEGLEYLAEARQATGLPVVSEVMDTDSLPAALDYIDVIQVGARNMQNYPLLRAVGKTTKPVLLKRGLSATIEEWLMAAEYILNEGNSNVILCERGIRTFETATRNTLDLNAVPVVKDLTHLPILIDPSHGVGIARYVPAMSMASLAAGADGLLLEVHPTPETALSDGEQSLTPLQFHQLMKRVEHYVAFQASFDMETSLYG
ncbi:3-deoxy-7-phosphoheptulonate synthase [Alicyclobacillus sp. ALC3]|uniref:3-deoxy-7-phosphoheptulonate synthase n=1 Tax=Alicyclobacillus sp. ALC3 TaxID=2796143 RepID=UPI002378881A|nr:3-deoxy-7-phosphoheptulonate synthase [Alicyclobacillus sp. ALC3]WDL95705.1 3-deoxy-7-phosphoheptulonate synthase [Alicyclobacillus sp. ALC3]